MSKQEFEASEDFKSWKGQTPLTISKKAQYGPVFTSTGRKDHESTQKILKRSEPVETHTKDVAYSSGACKTTNINLF